MTNLILQTLYDVSKTRLFTLNEIQILTETILSEYNLEDQIKEINYGSSKGYAFDVATFNEETKTLHLNFLDEKKKINGVIEKYMSITYKNNDIYEKNKETIRNILRSAQVARQNALASKVKYNMDDINKIYYTSEENFIEPYIYVLTEETKKLMNEKIKTYEEGGEAKANKVGKSVLLYSIMQRVNSVHDLPKKMALLNALEAEQNIYTMDNLFVDEKIQAYRNYDEIVERSYLYNTKLKDIGVEDLRKTLSPLNKYFENYNPNALNKLPFYSNNLDEYKDNVVSLLKEEEIKKYGLPVKEKVLVKTLSR